MITEPKSELRINFEALRAYEAQYQMHLSKVTHPHPMCFTCTFIENELRYRRQTCRRLFQGKVKLQRYIEGF